MFYTINNTINFRDTDGLIWLNHDEESSISLTTTTSRLLAFLLERQGEVVHRDEILSKVWDAHGLRSSNNSLNKYISDLRNIFRNLGYSEELIVTVPRIGFMFSADVELEKHILDDQVQAIPVIAVENRPTKKRRSIIIVSAAIIILALLLILSMHKNNSELLSSKTWPTGNVNGCHVFSFAPASTETNRIKLAIVKDILDSGKMTCQPDGNIYFQAADAVLYGSAGRVFLSFCRNSDDARKPFASCYNFYETSYEIKK